MSAAQESTSHWMPRLASYCGEPGSGGKWTMAMMGRSAPKVSLSIVSCSCRPSRSGRAGKGVGRLGIEKPDLGGIEKQALAAAEGGAKVAAELRGDLGGGRPGQAEHQNHLAAERLQRHDAALDGEPGGLRRRL